MIFEEALEILRKDILFDTKREYLWSDNQLKRFYNRAITEACERAELLRGSKTLAITADNASLKLPDQAITIDKAILDSNYNNLRQASEAEMLERYGPTWHIDEGTPSFFLRKNKNITLYPIPTDNDSVTFYYTRRTDDADLVEQLTDEAPIDERYHYPLLYWVAYLAYDRVDMDTYNPGRAQLFQQKFNQAFGIRHSAALDAYSRDTPIHSRVLPRRFV